MKGQFEVIDVASPVYFSCVKVVRVVSEKFLNGRGVGKFDSFSRTFVPTEKTWITLQLNHDAKFVLPAADSYWGHYLLEGRPYEPEIEWVLRAIAEVPYAFIDGGANFGYWSVLTTSAEFGGHQAIAVEMSPKTLDILQRNRAANGNRFDIIEAAIAGEEGGFAVFSDSGWHSGRSAAKPAQGAEDIVRVPTVSIDGLARRVESPQSGLVLKLDIEGYEPEAIRKSKVIRENPNVLLLVEDHYKDPECKTLQACFESGLSALYIDPEGDVHVIGSLEQARAVKLQPGKGYNFFAYHSSSEAPLAVLMDALIQRGTVFI